MMQEDIGYFKSGSLITLFVILGNLIFFLGLPFLVAYYLKYSISKQQKAEEIVL
jgi:hypothetical protein